MSDSAKGSVSGYLFQFERALLLLSNLENSSDYVSIEDVDDIATHKNDGTVLITDQAKHSIAQSGTTFKDTSYSLWRTLQLWIEKVESDVLGANTQFICSTNKAIPKNSLIYIICNNEFSKVKEKVKLLEETQKEKLKKIKKEKNSTGNSIKSILKLISFVLKKEATFKRIHPFISIEDNIDLKESVLNRLHLNSEIYSNNQRDNIYESMYGWISSNSLYKWKNSECAHFKKVEFDDKYHSTLNRPSIVQALFRAKKDVSISDNDISRKKNDLFVKQIDILPRRNKESIIKKAIEDFLRYEIEHTYVINELGDFTREEFNEFIQSCYDKWQSHFDSKFIYDFSEYDEADKTKKAIEIYDHIMNDLKMNFNNDYNFNTDNVYIKNGSFLKLSNIPKIGWHPEWEKKFKDD